MDWQNSPTARHNKGAGFSFADGHAEIWKWLYLDKDQTWDTQANANTTYKDLQRLENAVAQP